MSRRAVEASPRLLSVEEYANLRESDEYRSELVRGVLVRERRPAWAHARTQVRLAARIHAHVEEEGLGAVLTDVGVALPGLPRTVRGPDIAFWATANIPDPVPRVFPETAPDLAVEIVSPSNTVSGLQEKVTDYLQAGTRLVWVVDPESRTATVYRSLEDIRILTEDGVLDGGEVVPGFRVPLREVWP